MLASFEVSAADCDFRTIRRYLIRKRSEVQVLAGPRRNLQVRHGLATSGVSLDRARGGRREPNGEPVHHADFSPARWVEMVFMVSAPLVITGSS